MKTENYNPGTEFNNFDVFNQNLIKNKVIEIVGGFHKEYHICNLEEYLHYNWSLTENQSTELAKYLLSEYSEGQ